MDIIKAEISVSETYRLLGLLCRRRPLSASWRARCPLCARSPHSQTASVLGQEWYCHRCKHGGDAIRLVALVEDLDDYAAAARLCELAGITVPYRSRASYRRPRAPRGTEKGAVRGSGGQAPRDDHESPSPQTGE